CRSESIQKGRVVQVVFDTGAREIRINDPEEEPAADGQVSKLRVYPLPKGIQMRDIQVIPPEFESDLPAIEFYPTGGTNGGSLILDGRDQKTAYRIVVHPVTGIVGIEG
ncbi:MAG TPA: GspH/FimT family pseudopilin, partial [Thermodesulfobacteriota bacterium]|nr:GspH/FimT family pseudopilin [Thermodesulfobacteriota bacterium]